MDAQTILTIIMMFIVVLGISVCHVSTALADSVGKEEIIAVARANNAFAADVYRLLKTTPGNLVFSPYSLFTILTMTQAGAQQNTEAQMTKVLHLPFHSSQMHQALAAWDKALRTSPGTQSSYQLYNANALWSQAGEKLLSEFTVLLQTYYDAEVTMLDFAQSSQHAIDAINTWVQERTQGKIPELLDPQAAVQNLSLVLTNAIYFKGQWQVPFDPEKTGPAPFTLIDGQQVEVPMMRQTANVLYGEDEFVQVLELPYEHSEHVTPLSMFFILPNDPATFTQCEAKLSADNLEQLFAAMQPHKVAVSLPRLNVNSSFSLSEMLIALGMTDAFSLPPADFSGITGGQDIYLSEVLHKVVLEVNEAGSEAAGASAVMMSRGLAPTPVFQADHPFWLLIRDNVTGGILFWGRILDPRG
ncbi:proteinase inhibitor I4, serpin [Candidatus Vecturithrix granuli]|uniref:Proteinase inhibitor I4, serpin n=1 Tax=Vecturithrix granuli TaxID=1499967 RepID=A0A081BVP5_VECG1|nr:proteinase inhibitor I4, serpin [Candidatus Vecturithrix granuli]